MKSKSRFPNLSRNLFISIPFGLAPLLSMVPHAGAATSSTWSYATLTPSVTTAASSADLVMDSGTYAVGQLITLPAVGGIEAGTYYIASVSGGATIRISTAPGGTPVVATATESGTATYMYDWTDASRWSPGVPDTNGETAAFPDADVAGAGNISVSGSQTIHGFNFTGSGSQNVDLTINGGANGTSVGALNFATDDSSTPVVTMDGTGTSRLVNFGGTRPINFSGNQGLAFRGAIGTVTGAGLAATATNPTKQIRLTNVAWTGFSGGIAIERGEVQIQNNDQLPTTQDLTIGNDYSSANSKIAVLNLGSEKNQKVGNLNGNEWGRVRAPGTLTVGNGNATGGDFGGIIGQNMAGTTTSTNLTKTGTGTQTISGPIKGGGTVTAGGAGGTLILSGDNSFTGETVASAGTLALAHPNAIANSSNLRIAGSATFDNTSGAPISFAGGLLMNSGSPTFTGTREMTFAGASNIGSGVTRTITVTGGTLTLAGVLGESTLATSGSLAKAGAGTLVLSNANTYTGLTSVNAGILRLGNATALGGSTINAEVTTTAASTSASVVAAQKLSVGQLVTGPNVPANTKITAISGTTLTLSQAATGTGTTPATFEGMTDINSGGTLDLNGQTIHEPFTGLDGAGAGGIGALINSDTANPAQLANDVTNIGSFTIGGDGDLTASRFIGTSGSRTLTKIGAGTVTTHGSSHNNLVAWVIESGAVVLANSSGFGADRGVTINGGTLQLAGANANLINNDQSFTVNGGVFDLNGKSEAVASVGGTGGTIRNTAATAGTLFVGGGPGGSSSASFAGAIEDGTGTLGLTKEGSGTQTLTGTLAYTGDTTVSGGTLSINSASLNNAATVAIANGAVLDLTHGAIDDVAALKFNNVTQAAGTYNSSNSGGYITGSGSIRVAAAGYSGWATTNAASKAANLDHDNDGTANGVEYFMNAAAGFTANPVLVNGSVTWPNGGNIPSTAYGTQFIVQTSSDLVAWTNVPSNDPNLDNSIGSVTFTLTGTGSRFVRLIVTPN